jgi:hypothetical protein
MLIGSRRGSELPQSIYTARHKRPCELLKMQRKAAGLDADGLAASTSIILRSSKMDRVVPQWSLKAIHTSARKSKESKDMSAV